MISRLWQKSYKNYVINTTMWCKQHNFAGHMHPAMIQKTGAAVYSLLLKMRGSTGYGLVFRRAIPVIQQGGIVPGGLRFFVVIYPKNG